MDIFIARQPIFNTRLEIYGYELFYRNNLNNEANFNDGNVASSSVIVNSLMLLGLENISDNKLSFINFTENLIKEEAPTIFSPESLFVEILEDIKPTESFIEACIHLKNQGYKFALDDYILNNYNESLLKIIDIVKVDFLQTTKDERIKIAKQLKPFNVKMLAEKVETYDEFEEAKEFGYTYFQGYFFQRPQVIENKEIEESFQTYIRILKELNKSIPEFSSITQVIETDVSLAYKVLKLVNSPAFSARSRVTSLNQALVRLGFREIRKVVSILMLRNINPDKPTELVRTSLVRAKLAEYISIAMDNKKRSSEYFILGLFSTIDALMDQPMEKIMTDLPLEADLKDALIGNKNIFKDVLDIIKLYERGYWEVVARRSKAIGLDDRVIPTLYLDALTWSNQAMSDI
jgi:EAL and modified HD-GYP domain-containing signal transduction protein